MRLDEARGYRDELRRAGIQATVPTGYGPKRYFVQIWSSRWGDPGSPHRFGTADEVETFLKVLTDERVRHEWLVEHPPRTALDAMIDKAVGLR